MHYYVEQNIEPTHSSGVSLGSIGSCYLVIPGFLNRESSHA